MNVSIKTIPPQADTFKELILSISVAGIKGHEIYDRDSFLLKKQAKQEIVKKIFNEKDRSPELTEAMEAIHKFSNTYGGYDAHSLTLFYDIDHFIKNLWDLHKTYQKMKNSKYTSISNVYPKCFHKSDITTLYSVDYFKFDDTTDTLNFNIDYNHNDFDLEIAVRRLILKIREKQRACLPSSKMNFLTEYPNLEGFINGDRKKRIAPKEALLRFLGLKIYDEVRRQKANGIKTSQNIVIIEVMKWFNNEFKLMPEQKNTNSKSNPDESSSNEDKEFLETKTLESHIANTNKCIRLGEYKKIKNNDETE